MKYTTKLGIILTAMTGVWTPSKAMDAPLPPVTVQSSSSCFTSPETRKGNASPAGNPNAPANRLWGESLWGSLPAEEVGVRINCDQPIEELTVNPKIAATGIINAASYKGSEVSPGEIRAVYGAYLGPSSSPASSEIDLSIPAQGTAQNISITGSAFASGSHVAIILGGLDGSFTISVSNTPLSDFGSQTTEFFWQGWGVGVKFADHGKTAFLTFVRDEAAVKPYQIRPFWTAPPIDAISVGFKSHRTRAGPIQKIVLPDPFGFKRPKLFAETYQGPSDCGLPRAKYLFELNQISSTVGRRVFVVLTSTETLHRPIFSTIPLVTPLRT